MSREAMQLALEALESDPISHAGLVSRKQAITALRQALKEERESIRLQCTTCGTVYADGLPPQVAQPEQKCAHEIDQKGCDWCKPARQEQEPLCWTVSTGWVYADDTSQERVDETTKQEPVAWANTLNFDDDDTEIIPAKAKGKLGTSNCDIPLYTAPPKRNLTCVCGAVWEGETMVHPPRKREWVGLTLNEAKDFYEKYTDRAELINAIDKFLEEKNA